MIPDGLPHRVDFLVIELSMILKTSLIKTNKHCVKCITYSNLFSSCRT